MSVAIRLLLIGLVTVLDAQAAEPVLSKDAPPDKPAHATTADEMDAIHKAMEPYIQEAKKTYPSARARFLKGLPRGEHFFVTTRLRDAEGRMEQVFIAVSAVEAGTIKGIIFSPIQGVSGYAYGQPYSFPESELVDWLIAKPDGSEEGNVVGKFLDTYGSH